MSKVENPMEQTPEQVEVKLLNYKFLFRRLRWQEEFAIEFPKKKDPQRVMLAYALLEVSGLKPKTVDEALRVIDAIPSAILYRVFRIWKGSFPAARRFTVSKLYKAPDPQQHIKQVETEEGAVDAAHGKRVSEMEAKFGSEQLADIREVEKKILAAARNPTGGYLGAVPASEDQSKDGL